MKVGIVGLPQTGKTTLFNALTRGQESTAPSGGARRDAAVATVAVPDTRFDFAVELFHPKKQTQASIEFVDGAAPFGTGADKATFGADFFEGLRKVDALVLVVRAFEADYPPAPEGGVRPGRDIQTVAEEMLLGDMALIETRLERIEKALRTRKAGAPSPELQEREVLLKLQAHMDEGRPLRTLALNPDEVRVTRSFAFLTEKPLMVVANIGEGGIGNEDGDPLVQQGREVSEAEGLPLIALCGKAEAEVAQLGPEEEKEFLEALGIESPARDRLIRLAYDTLGLMSFFTVGEDEVRAWTVEKGATAGQSAGKIHSDLERYFIRAEVLEFPKLIEAGSWDAAKPLVHLEMKDFPVKDGDILHIRAKKV